MHGGIIYTKWFITVLFAINGFVLAFLARSSDEDDALLFIFMGRREDMWLFIGYVNACVWCIWKLWLTMLWYVYLYIWVCMYTFVFIFVVKLLYSKLAIIVTIINQQLLMKCATQMSKNGVIN